MKKEDWAVALSFGFIVIAAFVIIRANMKDRAAIEASAQVGINNGNGPVVSLGDLLQERCGHLEYSPSKCADCKILVLMETIKSWRGSNG